MHLYNLNLLIKKMFSSWWLHGNKLEVSCILMQDTKVCRMRIWAPLSATTPDVFFYWNCCKKWLQCPSENERIHLAIKRTHFLTDIAVILHNDFKEKKYIWVSYWVRCSNSHSADFELSHLWTKADLWTPAFYTGQPTRLNFRTVMLVSNST